MDLSKSDKSLIGKLIALDALRHRALMKAVWLLAAARWQHMTRPIESVLTDFDNPSNGEAATDKEAELVGWAITSAAARVPWRSDCLLQAMAAARWLEALDRSYSLSIGVRKGDTGSIEAHAWLTSSQNTITGHTSELATYHPITGSEHKADSFHFL